MNCIFTICAKNYIGLAQILEDSIRIHDPETHFYIFVADELSEIKDVELQDNIIECKSALRDFITIDLWDEMSFKYNLTEFCTSIKTLCYNYLFVVKNYNKVIFLDPDIYAFSSFDYIFTQLKEFKIILSPHITTLNVKYKGPRSEKGIMSTGIFNLGFLALKKSSEVDVLLKWWGERLKMQCYIEPLDSYFTDQKWMDFLPSFFSSKTLSISDHIGINVAPWNFFEREIYQEGVNWYVRIRDYSKEGDSLSAYIQKEPAYPLLFVHFSGYDYKELILGKVKQNNIQNLGVYADIDTICNIYSNRLYEKKALFNNFYKYLYSYNTFENGVQITNFHRRLLRALIDEGEVCLNPFSVNKGSLYSKLTDKKLVIISAEDNVDKLNKINMSSSTNKLKKINLLMRVLFRLIGVKNYTLLLKLMRPYSRIENQLHLLNSKYDERLK